MSLACNVQCNVKYNIKAIIILSNISLVWNIIKLSISPVSVRESMSHAGSVDDLIIAHQSNNSGQVQGFWNIYVYFVN